MAKMGRPKKVQESEQLGTEDIIEKIATFLEEKQQLDAPSCYLVCKRLADDYFEEWANPEGEYPDLSDDEEEEGDFGISSDEVPEPPQEFRSKQASGGMVMNKDGRVVANPIKKQPMPPMPVI